VFARWIFPFLVWPMLAMAAEPETEAVLKEPVKFALVINGKKIGETKVAAGAKVQVAQRDGPRVLIRHGNSQEVWVQETQLDGLEKHDPQKDLEEGRALLAGEDKDGNWERGVELIRRAAEAGIPAGQREWGLLLLDGFCVKQDSAKGKELLLQAAAAGDGRAILESSPFAERSDDMQELLVKAAENGDPMAMVMMADDTASGRDNAKGDARSLLAKASESSDGVAIGVAATRYASAANDPKRREKLGMNTEELQKKALEGFRAAIEKGFLEASAGLSQMIRNGVGVPKDEAEADRLLVEFRRRCEARINKGSIATRFTMIFTLQNSPAELSRDETLRLMQEVLDKSEYAGYRRTARIIASHALADPRGGKNIEDVRAGIAWLEEASPEESNEFTAKRLEDYKKTLAEMELEQPKAE
jgi:TPR repeat protein